MPPCFSQVPCSLESPGRQVLRGSPSLSTMNNGQCRVFLPYTSRMHVLDLTSFNDKGLAAHVPCLRGACPSDEGPHPWIFKRSCVRHFTTSRGSDGPLHLNETTQRRLGLAGLHTRTRTHTHTYTHNQIAQEQT